MTNLRIVFMGTPEFAVGILDHIISNDYNVVGVVTAADKPAGRGKQIKQSAVKEYALNKGLRLMQPTSLKDPGFLSELESLEANVNVVVAFRMLPEAVWRMPQYGTFNLHASLLPQYRGAAPINWAIINGERKTGVSTFFIDDKIDTGAIILQSELEIFPDENAGQLHNRLMELGKIAVANTLNLIAAGEVNTVQQLESDELRMAPKLNKDNCRINWDQPAQQVYNMIRGLSPYPASWCLFRDKEQEWSVKILEAEIIDQKTDAQVGTILSSKKELKIAARGELIKIKRLQMAGKKAMTAGELMNGMSFSDDAIAC